MSDRLNEPFDTSVVSKTILAAMVSGVLAATPLPARANWFCDVAAQCFHHCFDEGEHADVTSCEADRQANDRVCETEFNGCTNPPGDSNFCNTRRQECRNQNNEIEAACIYEIRKAVVDSCFENCEFWRVMCDATS